MSATSNELSSVGMQEQPGSALLDVRGLSVAFKSIAGPLTVVDDVSFAVPRNSVMALVGESGSGKSVTALAVAGLIPFVGGTVTSGAVEFGGVDLLKLSRREVNAIRGKRIGFIFQDPMSCLNPAFRIGDQIAEVVRRHKDSSRKTAWKRAVEMLDRVGIASAEARARDYPHQFSGGMRQRVMIALALACDPELLIADEPTTALDVTVQARILEIIEELKAANGMSVLFITHDLGVVAEIADDVTVLYAAEVVERARVHRLFESPSHPYTAALLNSMPQVALKTGRDVLGIPGMVAQAHAWPSGCRFHPRCSHMVEGTCTTDRIELRHVGGSASRCARAEELRATLGEAGLGREAFDG